MRIFNNKNIKIDGGKTKLSVSIDEYNKARNVEKPKALCYAPFVNIDFGQSGKVNLCNHSISPITHVDENFSILSYWRGQEMKQQRKQMRQYCLDKDICRHCVKQIESKNLSEVFSILQFDSPKKIERNPKYPKRMIFRLNNTCNLACVMCFPDVSSRIRKELHGLEQKQTPYGEKFFEELYEILPHLEHVEFYGGEPFLIKEHLRILEMIQETNSTCTIFVNTNATCFSPKVKDYIENMNFTHIAVSMDAVSDRLHSEVRKGIKNELFLKNIDWLLKLRERKKLFVGLNVTEHRKNWFELGEIFHFAEEKKIKLHINTCIYPENVSLYALQKTELNYVTDFIKEQYENYLKAYKDPINKKSFEFLISLLDQELAKETHNWKPSQVWQSKICDGKLRSPIPGSKPFETIEKFKIEIERIKNSLPLETQSEFFKEINKDLEVLGKEDKSWLKLIITDASST